MKINKAFEKKALESAPAKTDLFSLVLLFFFSITTFPSFTVSFQITILIY